MVQAHKRKKAPEEIRRQVLVATEGLALESGPESITLEAVARRAGVSKGGLQYHFPSREALFNALLDATWERFRKRLEEEVDADPEPTGRFTRAYLKTVAAPTSADEKQLGLLVTILMLGDSDYRRRWTEKMLSAMPAEAPADPEATARLLICRFAADGFWLNDLAGVHGMTTEVRDSFLKQLCELTER